MNRATNPIHSDRSGADHDAEWLGVLHRKLDGLRFGVIQLVVHDGRVVQVDCTERTRFPQSPPPDGDH